MTRLCENRMLCYIDRVNISIAIIPLAHAKGYSEAERGLILSSFFWGFSIRAADA